MNIPVRIKKIKELEFQRPDGQIVGLSIPPELNQSLLKSTKFADYSIFTMAVGRDAAESEVCSLKHKGNLIGFLIPGQAILSPDHPQNRDKYFGTYSLIIALAICVEAQSNFYKLASKKYEQAESRKDIFTTGIFYAVIWIKKLETSSSDFLNNYFVSLAINGIYQTINGNKPLPSSRTLESYNTSISIIRNREWPDYIKTILVNLAPFANDAFLRFFYLYQVIETLMTENYSQRLTTIKTRFESQHEISITQLKGFLNDFQEIVKEEPRIKNALQPPCPESNLISEKILTALGEDFEKLEFGQRIYKIRNIIFHDYRRIHHLDSHIAELEDSLSSFILNKKLI